MMKHRHDMLLVHDRNNNRVSVYIFNIRWNIQNQDLLVAHQILGIFNLFVFIHIFDAIINYYTFFKYLIKHSLLN